jgi:hypothetical protein
MPRPYAYACKKSPKSDPQQHQVYRMESEALGARNYQSMSRANIVRLVNGVCRVYKISRPTVRYKDLGKWAAQWISPTYQEERGRTRLIFPAVIELSTRKRTSMDFITITHELAHHLHASFGAATDKHAGHGAEFMACHISILDTVRAIPVYAMRTVCRQYRIKFRDPGTRNNLGDLLRAVVGRRRKRAATRVSPRRRSP